MSRDSIPGGDASAWRCATVWWCATSATVTAWWLLAPTVAALTAPTGWTDAFDVLLVRVCAAILLPSTGWLWLVTTSTVLGALRGRPCGANATRRLVLLTCGVAVAAGAAAPAGADTQATGTGSAVIAGLSLPDRAVSNPHRREHVVVPGDSLWSIAESHRGPQTSTEDRWRTIWTANRHVIGDDPDLILPGQRLALPPAHDDHRRAR